MAPTPSPHPSPGEGPTAYLVHGYRLRVPAGLTLPAPLQPRQPAEPLQPLQPASALDVEAHLAGAPGEPDRGAPDPPTRTVDVEIAPPAAVPPEPPPGELLAALADEDGPLYSIARTAQALTLRFHGYAEIVADPLLRKATAHVHPGVDQGVLAVLLPGTVMAVRLLLDGHLVLHASAVERDGAAVAFAGPSGSGKSTLAALGVLAGLRLVTDDVLRVDLDGPAEPVAQVWPGAAAVRLRPDVAHLAELARRPGQAAGEDGPMPPVPPARRTADGRVALPAADVVAGPIPLRHIVLPRLAPEAAAPQVRTLDAVVAAQRLLLAPRVLGWTHPEQLRHQFERTIDLCERVGVVELDVPQARRGDPDVVPESLDLLENQRSDG